MNSVKQQRNMSTYKSVMWQCHKYGNREGVAKGRTSATPITITKLLYLLITSTVLLPGATATSSLTATMKTKTTLKCNLSTPVSVVAASERFSCQQQEAAVELQELDGPRNYQEREWKEEETNLTRRRNESSSWDVVHDHYLLKLNETDLRKTRTRNNYPFLLPRILSLANTRNVNQWCLSEIHLLKQALEGNKEIWALKVLDASGNYKPGFMLGNNHWLGSKALCDHVATRNPMHINYSRRFNRNSAPSLLSATAPFDVHYAVVYVKHRSPLQFEMRFMSESVLHVGLCIPSSCSAAEIAQLTALHFTGAAAGEDSVARTFQLRIDRHTQVHGKILKLPEEFTQKIGYKLLKYLVCTSVTLTVLATLNSNRRDIPPVDELSSRAEEEGREECRHQTTVASIGDPFVNSESGAGVEEAAASPRKGSLCLEMHLRRILNCFSLTDNFRTLWCSPERDSCPAPSPALSSIPVIDGVRSICCLLILCFHVCWFTFFQTTNPTELFSHAESVRVALIANAPLLVDIFFAISGFLHCYNFFREPQKVERIRKQSLKGNLKYIGRSLLHRYVRLSLVHLIVVLMTQVGVSYLSHMSQFLIFDRDDLTCQRYWWRNLLLIQNLFGLESLCCSWTWSVACEMQFHAVFTIGFVLYAKHPQLMAKVFWYSTALIALVALIISIQLKFQLSFDVMFATGSQLYLPPWSRIHPYVSGTFLAWLICHRDFVNENRFQPLLALSKYLAVLVVLIFLTCATIDRSLCWMLSSLLMLVCRFAVGGAVVWLITLSRLQKERGPLVNFLGCRFFRHISRLSYTIYLVHPLVITVLYGLRSQGSHLELVTFIQDTMGILLIVYIFSLVLTVCLEMPLTRVLKLYLK